MRGVNLLFSAKTLYRGGIFIFFVILQFFSYSSSVFAFDSHIYTTNLGSNTVSIINSFDNNLNATVSVGLNPKGIASHGNYIYVANEGDKSISIIDKNSNNIVNTISLLNSPFSILLNHDGSYLYISYNGNNNNHTISVVDTSTFAVVKNLTGFASPQGMEISKDDSLLYVVSTNCCTNEKGFLSIVNLNTDTINANIPLEIISTNIVLSLDEKKAYVTNNGGENLGKGVSIIDLVSNTVLGKISVGINPYGIVTNSIGTYIYVTNTHWASGDSFGTVSVIDTSTDSVVATIPVGNTPNFLAISPDDKRVYVANTGSDTVSVIDTATNTVVDTIPVGSGPWGIVVSELTTLSVPYFSQNALPWGPTEYDSTKSLGTFAETMDRWGCAITSIAMVMKYQQIDTLPNGDALNPGSLNEWLKANNGYIKGYGPGGWYSFIDWSKIGTLSKKIFDQGLSEKKLEWKRLAATEQNLTNELENDRPPVLQVRNAATSMHFAVATGIQGDTFILNDPEWEYPDLTSFNNTFYQVDTFIPSLTNLSYITMYINPEVEILVTDPLGRKTGKQVINGIMQTYNEIPEALYGSEGPISNPNSEGDIEELGTGGNSFILPKPLAGLYTITLSSKEETFYTVNISATEADGDSSLKMLQGSVFPGQNDMNAITYSQDESSEIKKTVTFASTLEDIKELRELDFLHISKSLSLTALIKNAEKAYQRGDEKLAEKLIDLAIKQIEKSTTEFVDPIAKEILRLDFIQLKEMVTE